MALIECSSCGQGVSDKAKTCPKCGHPVKQAAITKPAGCFLQVISLPFIIGGLIATFNNSTAGGLLVLIIGFLLLYAGGRAAR